MKQWPMRRTPAPRLSPVERNLLHQEALERCLNLAESSSWQRQLIGTYATIGCPDTNSPGHRVDRRRSNLNGSRRHRQSGICFARDHIELMNFSVGASDEQFLADVVKCEPRWIRYSGRGSPESAALTASFVSSPSR